MKNLIFISLMLIVFNTQLIGQKSLAQRTGYNTSLYDATCELNGIVPGSIGMNEGRKLMQAYAKSIGLNYKLYELNGKNNMYILHYVPTIDTTVTYEEVFETNVQDLTELVDSMSTKSDMNNVVEDELVIVDTIRMIDTVEIIVSKVIVDTVTSVEVKEYCDCDGLTLEEAWTKHEMLKEEWKEDRLNHNGAINASCRVKLRQYIKYQQRVQFDLTRNERIENVDKIENTFGEPLLDAIQVSNNMVSTKPAKVTRKRKARKLGKGHSRGKNTSFWNKLFPFANC